MGSKVSAGLILPLLLAVAGGADAAELSHIGVTAAAKDNVRGTVEGVTQPIATGSSLYQEEVVATDAKSMAQLLFLDQTSLSVGPQSEIKLDRFVYDPDKKRGDVVLEASRGAFRFITGQQDPRSYTLKTPVATIGVRGTIVDYSIENGRLVIRLVEGKASITLENGKLVNLEKPGDAIVVLSDGAIIGPVPWDGEIDTAISGTTFPLYGSKFVGTPDDTPEKRLDFDDKATINDELASHGVSSVQTAAVTPEPPAVEPPAVEPPPSLPPPDLPGGDDGGDDEGGGHHGHHRHHHHHDDHHGGHGGHGGDTE